MTEDEELKARIAQLSGQIKRHKTGDTVDSYAELDYSPQAYGYGGYQPAPRGNYRGSRGRGRGGRSHLHRNKTLVLNAGSAVPGADEQSQSDGLISTAPAFVSKTGRHRQLINTSIYDKETEKRVKAMEVTRLEKLKRKDEREKLKFHKRLQNSKGSSYSDPSNDIITIQGIQFRLTKNGSKLAKISGEIAKIDIRGLVRGLWFVGDRNAAKDTPKSAIIQGVKFYRSRSGNMYRYAFIKAHRKPGPVKKVDELCKIFNTTGSCLKGPRCRYIHDPQKVAACKELLQKGSCPSGDSCDLSHDLTPERTPTCLHFSKGNCSNPDCRYTHIRVSPTALVCRAFGIYGYCDKGANCTERHVNECPDFSNTGSCPTKGCKLLHRSKASVMRNNPAPAAAADDSDFSSDEDEDEIGSDDVDSDALEELFDDEDGEKDEDIPMQHDFVQLK